MKEQLTKDLSLKLMEKIISEEIKGKELWGDIAISEEEYENIRDRIKAILENSSLTITDLCIIYPISITTFMVFLMRYKYDTNFWGLVREELNIPICGPIESEIGSCVRSTFTKNKFDYSDVKDERRINMEPILYEAGLPPESCLDDLFYVLKYDSHSIFDPRLIIEDLIDMRSYHIRKPMLRFLKRFQNDRALEFVLEVRDAMLCVDQRRSGNSRYIGKYTDWKAEEKTCGRGNRRKKQEFQTRPYLSFENGKRGLCMVLPHTILANEWIDDVAWVIACSDGTEIRKKMTVFGDEGRRFVQSVEIPVCVANEYCISLVDEESIEESVIIEWTILGVGNDGILFFNSNGRIVTSNYLQLPYGIMLLGKNVKLLECKHVNSVYQSYPTDRENFRIVSLEPLGRDAEVKYFAVGESVTLKARPQVNISFEGRLLFSMPNDGKFRLFTEIPDLDISIDEMAFTDGLNLRIGKEVVDISNIFEAGNAHIQLKKYDDNIFIQYGTYSIRLYQHDSFLRQAEFSYVPKIKTTYSAIMRWPEMNERKSKRIFKFERMDDWQLEFDECVVYSNKENYVVECPEGMGVVYGRIKSADTDNNYVCSFELPINPLAVEVISSDGEFQETITNRVVRLGLSDIDMKEYWISMESFGKYKNSHYSVKLHSANGIEQEESICLSKDGGGNLNLACFYDSLRACPLPAQLELWCDDSEEKVLPLIVISDTVELNKRPSFVSGKNKDFISLSINDDERDLVVKRFGVKQIEYHLQYSTSKLSNTGERRGYPLEERLVDGIYIIESNKQQGDFIFEDEGNFEITNGKNILYISAREKGTPIKDFKSWIDQLIRDIIQAGITSDIRQLKAYNLLGKLSELPTDGIGIEEYEKMTALAFFANSKCVDVKKNSIYECMREISEKVLDARKRLEIIRVLADVNCPQEVFDLCLDIYNLLLFEPGAADSKSLAGKIENNSTELSLLLLMGIDAPLRDTIYRDKYRELIGRESIKALLSVPGEKDVLMIAEEQKRFLREQSPCRVKINLTNEISGYMKPIQEMLEVTYKSIVFNKSKKPDFGLYFDRIRYVDQYVNWYSLSHNKDGDMYPEKRSMMLEAVKKNCVNIVKYTKNLNMGGLHSIVSRYDEALHDRTESDLLSNMNANDYSRYFYLQGMAALFAKLPPEFRKYGEAIKTGENFMIYASTIAPRISRRDIVMASTFIYLMRKEEKICR